MTKDHKREVQDDTKPAKEETREAKNLVYVHEPGTVHLSAFEANVEDAKQRLQQAQGDVEAAERALEEKKANSTFVEAL